MTAVATDRSRHGDDIHEHGWLTESSHQTSEGRVVYVRCTHCGVRRVDRQSHPGLPPGSMSIEV